MTRAARKLLAKELSKELMKAESFLLVTSKEGKSTRSETSNDDSAILLANLFNANPHLFRMVIEILENEGEEEFCNCEESDKMDFFTEKNELELTEKLIDKLIKDTEAPSREVFMDMKSRGFKWNTVRKSFVSPKEFFGMFGE